MSIKILIGEKLPLNLLLEEGETDKFPTAIVYDIYGNIIVGSPFPLIHIDKGLYMNRDYTVLDTDKRLFATYFVYDDAPHLNENMQYHPRSQDIFDMDSNSLVISDIEDLKSYLISVLDAGKLDGMVELEEDCYGLVPDDDIEAFIGEDESILGIVLEPTGASGEVDATPNIEGEMR